jgi:pimeloyl-ACP methyl ester carboxylesterase
MCRAALPAAPEKGFQAERRVRGPTGLDWECVAPPRAKLPVRYDSRQQRYQLFVPVSYRETVSWPVVVFLSPGDDPLGWRGWRKPCESGDCFFAAPYGVGASCPEAQRARAVLDVLDDVRRHYRIDPERTYLAGFSAGAALACRIAFALPELFGGVVVLSGDAPLPQLEHLRTRAAERLSVALIVGDRDSGRAQHESYLAPLYRDLGIRTRLWREPGLGRALPTDGVLAEVQRWLDEDVKRRQTDRRERIGAEEATHRAVAARELERARKELNQPDHLQRGAARLQWIGQRWPRTEAAETASELLAEVRADPRRGKALSAQEAASQKAFLGAKARALEAVGQLQSARYAWEAIARLSQPEERGKADGEIKRLAGRLRGMPYLGVVFEGDTTTIKAVLPGGPAQRAGLRPGDRLDEVDRVKVASPDDVRRQVAGIEPGRVLALVLVRAGKRTALDLTVGALPDKEE